MSSTHVLRMNGCPIYGKSKVGFPHLQVDIIKSPYEYSDSVSKRDWDYIGSAVKQMQVPLCQGGIGSGFFTKSKHREETSVVFLLYGLPKSGRKNLYAFAMCNDLSQDRHSEDRESDEKALYIDAICANAKQIREDRRVGTEVSIGKILINQIEKWGLKNGNDSIRLSALPYVIQYYRKLGYRHIKPGQSEDDEDVKISNIANQLSNLRFQSDEVLEQAHKIELALSHQAIGNARERLEMNLRALNDYIPEYLFVEGNEGVGSISVLPRGYDLEDLDLAFKDDRQTLKDIMTLENVVNGKRMGVERAIQAGTLDNNTFLLKEYFRALVQNGFAVNCPQSVTERLMIEMSYDEANMACDANGYTMRKKLRRTGRLIKCSHKKKSAVGGSRTHKNKSK